jgi:hypothetical protein
VYRVSELCAEVEVAFGARAPYPLSIVPRPLLNYTGSAVAKLAMAALLPSFLELLSVDYRRWAAGLTRAADGNLVALPAATPLSAGEAAGAASVIDALSSAAPPAVALEAEAAAEEEEAEVPPGHG